MSQIQDHFDDPYHRGDCECATHAATNALKGVESECQIQLELAVEKEGQILEAWWDGRACRFCEGFASIVCERIEGNARDELDVAELRAFAASLQSQNQDLSGSEASESTVTECSNCGELVVDILQKCLESPVNVLDDDLADGNQFGGPSLREEC